MQKVQCKIEEYKIKQTFTIEIDMIKEIKRRRKEEIEEEG